MREFDFLRDKYGPELLVDCAWATELEAFPLQEEPHRLSFFDIFLVTGGCGEFWLDADRHAVEAGIVYFTTPGQIRRWRVVDLEGLCLFFPQEFLEQLFADPLFLHRLRIFHPARRRSALRLDSSQRGWLRERLLRMREELRELHDDSGHLLRAMLYEILVILSRIYAEHVGAGADQPITETAFRFLQLVEREFANQHRLPYYCRALGVSPSRLRELSRTALGAAPASLIRRRLTIEARRLLIYSDLTSERIAERLGFADPSYFGRFVRRETGLTPSALRARGRAEELPAPSGSTV